MFPGVAVTEETQRTYPYGDLAAQVLGYVDVINAAGAHRATRQGYNSNSEFGQTGVESAVRECSARHGRVTNGLQVNAQGTVVGILGPDEPSSGDDVVLNMDAGLQQDSRVTLCRARS